MKRVIRHDRCARQATARRLPTLWSTTVVLSAALVACASSVLVQARTPPRQETPVPQVTAQPAAAPVAPSGAPPLLVPVEANPPAVPVAPPRSAIAAPSDPRLAQVYAIFDSACASCHQSGRTTSLAPGGGFANILDLASLAREPHLLRRGEPDASRLYHVLLDRHRPLELPADVKWPGADDIARVRTFIAEMEPAACVRPEPSRPADLARLIDQAVREAGEAQGQDLRFITLTHLADACATEAELSGYRQAVSKLLNSLSWGARPVLPSPVDPAQTVLSFKLSDIGWIGEHWDALARAEPKGHARELAALLTVPGANARPIRGDWLVHAASQPPFYAELLGLPPTLDETARLLGINRESELVGAKARRAGMKASGLFRGPRVIDLHRADTRRLWVAYDFTDGSGERDVLERPLGGVRGAADRLQFRADGMRMMFGLPNGFLAYGLHEPDGRRIELLPSRLEPDPLRSAGPTVAGLSCMGCHTSGLKPFNDGVRAHSGGDRLSGSREQRDQILALHPPQGEWTTIFDDDGFRHRRALIQAGVDPDLLVHGLEPVNALARRYMLDVVLAGVAAEALMSVAQVEARLLELDLGDRSLAPRLRQGVLTRAEANRVLAALATRPGEPESPPSGRTAAQAPAAVPEPALRLKFWTDKPAYKSGDLMTVYAQASAACHVTVISTDRTGKATVLFPNEFEPDNLLKPGMTLSVPADKAAYTFRLKETGAESLIAQCQTAAKLPPGVEPDYERQRFTVLGRYENFLRTSLDEAGRVRSRAAKPAPAGKDQKSDAKSEPPSDMIARAAVRIAID